MSRSNNERNNKRSINHQNPSTKQPKEEIMDTDREISTFKGSEELHSIISRG
jgi:hypothetical protein